MVLWKGLEVAGDAGCAFVLDYSNLLFLRCAKYLFFLLFASAAFLYEFLTYYCYYRCVVLILRENRYELLPASPLAQDMRKISSSVFYELRDLIILPLDSFLS